MAMVNTNESTGYQFPQTWVVMAFLLGIGALSVLATVAPGAPGAFDPNLYAPTANAAPASSGEGQDNSRECDPVRGIGSQCIFP